MLHNDRSKWKEIANTLRAHFFGDMGLILELLLTVPGSRTVMLSLALRGDLYGVVQATGATGAASETSLLARSRLKNRCAGLFSRSRTGFSWLELAMVSSMSLDSGVSAVGTKVSGFTSARMFSYESFLASSEDLFLLNPVVADLDSSQALAFVKDFLRISSMMVMLL